MSQTREQRRHEPLVFQEAEMERFCRKCEREIKEDYDAKLVAIREATRMEIVKKTRRIHEQLSTVYSEAQTKSAEEYSKLEKQKTELKREFERQRRRCRASLTV
jgi:phosphotransacetylase